MRPLRARNLLIGSLQTFADYLLLVHHATLRSSSTLQLGLDGNARRPSRSRRHWILQRNQCGMGFRISTRRLLVLLPIHRRTRLLLSRCRDPFDSTSCQGEFSLETVYNRTSSFLITDSFPLLLQTVVLARNAYNLIGIVSESLLDFLSSFSLRLTLDLFSQTTSSSLACSLLLSGIGGPRQVSLSSLRYPGANWDRLALPQSRFG